MKSSLCSRRTTEADRGESLRFGKKCTDCSTEKKPPPTRPLRRANWATCAKQQHRCQSIQDISRWLWRRGTTEIGNIAAAVGVAAILAFSVFAPAAVNGLDWVSLDENKSAFVLKPSGGKFTPWGFNYDHDEQGRLIEDYWDSEWPKVEEDFREMKQLGANVVRVHLQLGKFMVDEDQPNRHALRQLDRLIRLSEQLQLYLDLTGLGCYHKADVPPWYDSLPEKRRWSVQARFWQAVARQGRDSPAIFCYDLMNEPVVPPDQGKRHDWLGAPFAGKHFVQWIALEAEGRSRPVLACQWIKSLTEAIRREDPRHLITVGLVPWSLDRPGLNSGFAPAAIVKELDFLSVHLYPERSKVDEALETLRGFAVGKPVLIEETFPLKCSFEEFAEFMLRSRAVASGWIGFYWGKSLAECRQAKGIPEALMAGWLEFFQRESAVMRSFKQR